MRGPEARAGAARRREDGQVLLLGIGLITAVLALVLVVAGATAVYLDLKTLTAMADSAAAAAADGVDERSYFEDGGGGPGYLTDAVVATEAVTDLRAQPDAPDSLRMTGASTPDGVTAVVTLTARSRPPFLPWGIIPSEGFAITATGTARAVEVP